MAGNRRAARVFYHRKKKVKIKKNDARKKKKSHFHMLLFDPEEDKTSSGMSDVESILLSIILTLGYRGEGIICFDLDNESDSMDSDFLELIRLNCVAENYGKNNVLYWKKKKVKMKNGIPGENLLQQRCTSATSGQKRCLNVCSRDSAVCTRVRIWLRKYARLFLRRLLLTFAGKIIKTLRLRDLSGRQSRNSPRFPVNAVFDPGMKAMPNYLVLVHPVNKSVICIASEGNKCRCFMEEFCYKSYITNAYCSGILVYAVSKKILKMTSLYFKCKTWQLSISGLVRCLINSDLNGAYSLDAKSSSVDTYSYTAVSLRDICPDKRTASLNGNLERKFYFWCSKKHQNDGFLLSSASVDLTGYEDFVLVCYMYGFVSVTTDIPYKFVFPVLVVFVSSECVENICSSRRVEQIVKYTSLPGVCDCVSVYADETVFEKLLVITEYLKSISKGKDNNSHFKWINGYLVGVNLFQSKKNQYELKWINGYLVGVNLFQSKKKNQCESLLKWVNGYCIESNLSQSKKNQCESLLKWVNGYLVGVYLFQSKKKSQYEFLLKWINEYFVGVNLSQSKKNQYELKWIKECLVDVKSFQSKKNQYRFLLKWINEYLVGVNLSQSKKNQYEFLLKWINECLVGVKSFQSKKNQYRFLLKWINEYLVGVNLSQSKKNQYELKWIKECLVGVKSFQSKKNQYRFLLKWINEYLVGVNLSQSKKNQYEFLLKWINECLVGVKSFQSKKNQYRFLLKWINEYLVGVNLSQSKKKNQYESLLKWRNEYLVGVNLSQSKKNQYTFLLKWINEYLVGVNVSQSKKKNQCESLLKWINEFILYETWSLSGSHMCSYLSLVSKAKCICKFLQSSDYNSLLCNIEVSCKVSNDIVCRSWCNVADVCKCSQPRNMNLYYNSTSCECDSSRLYHFWNAASRIMDSSGSYFQKSDKYDLARFIDQQHISDLSEIRNEGLLCSFITDEQSTFIDQQHISDLSEIRNEGLLYSFITDDQSTLIDQQHISDLSEIRNEELLYSFITDEQSTFIDQQHISDLSEIRNEGLLYSFITDDNESMVYFGSCSNEPSYKRCFPYKYDIGEQIKVTNNSSIDKSSLAVINDNLLYSLFSCKSLLDKHPL